MNPRLIGVFLLLLGIIFLPTAFGDLQQSLTTKKPVKMSFTQFETDMPSEGWYQITGGQLHIPESLFVEEGDGVGNIYVPLRKKGSEVDAEQPVSILVKTNDPQIRNLIEKMRVVENKPQSEQEAFLLEYLDKFQIQKDLQGTIAEGVDALDSKDQGAIEAADIKLANKYVILQEGAKPSVAGRIFMLLFGLVICVGGLYMLLKKKAE